VDDENDFIMTHAISLWLKLPRMHVRWSKVGKRRDFTEIHQLFQAHVAKNYPAFPRPGLIFCPDNARV
jgi:hypothetical protein